MTCGLVSSSLAATSEAVSCSSFSSMSWVWISSASCACCLSSSSLSSRSSNSFCAAMAFTMGSLRTDMSPPPTLYSASSPITYTQCSAPAVGISTARSLKSYCNQQKSCQKKNAQSGETWKYKIQWEVTRYKNQSTLFVPDPFSS